MQFSSRDMLTTHALQRIYHITVSHVTDLNSFSNISQERAVLKKYKFEFRMLITTNIETVT